MAIGPLISFDKADSGRLAQHADPFRLFQEYRIAVFIKIDRTRNFVRTQAKVSAMFCAMGSYVPSDKNSDFMLGLAVDDDIMFLRLDDNSISELRDTGDCQVTTFRSGGLKRSDAVPAKRSRTGKLAIEAGPFEYISYGDCTLIDKECWEKIGTSGSNPFSWQRSINGQACAVRLKIYPKDIYLQISDVEMLKREGSLDWNCVEYPFANRNGLTAPISVYWLYQASIAMNRNNIPMPNGVLGWLEANAPAGAFSIRSKGTISKFADPSYKFMKRFDPVVLADFPPAEQLDFPYLTKPIRLLMAITEWWFDEVSNGRESRVDLLDKLMDARFESSVARTLTGVISGAHITDDEWKEMKMKMKSEQSDKVRKDIMGRMKKSRSPDAALLGINYVSPRR